MGTLQQISDLLAREMWGLRYLNALLSGRMWGLRFCSTERRLGRWIVRSINGGINRFKTACREFGTNEKVDT